MDNGMVRTLVDLRNQMQKTRIAFGNRLSAVQRGSDDGDENVLAFWEERFEKLENAAEGQIKDAVRNNRMVHDMTEVRGVGLLLAAKIWCMIDMSKAPTISSLWRYAGYGLNEAGERDRPRKGEKLVYNAKLRVALFTLAESFLRASSPYRDVYDTAKQKYQETRKDWTKIHIHLASMRKMIKVYLAHYYEHARELEGLPIREPYVFEKLGHTAKLHKADFGWPEAK